MAKKYRTIDLFAGIGGVRRGFEMTGRFENLLSSEIDKYACMAYEHLFGENPCNDVTDDEFKSKVESTEYDVLLGGFPCQAFSQAGKKEGFKDKTRGTLFFDVADIIDRTRPKAFLLENVRGLLSHQKGETFAVIVETLCRDLEYDVIGVEQVNDLFGAVYNYENNDFLLNTRHFGLPQNRPRVFLMGYDTREYGELLADKPIKKLPKEREALPIFRDLNELLELKAPVEFYLSQSTMDYLKRHRAEHESKGHGFGFIVVNSPEIEHPVSNTILATGGSGKERNLVYDPQEGFAGLVVKSKKTPINDDLIRYMTPREWGKLQGFIEYAFVKDGKDTFSFPETVKKGQQYKVFGNSVSIPVIEELAKMMIKNLDYLEGRAN